MYDVVILGAGVAGLMCAYRAAQSGLNVLLIDKKKEIGFPVRSTGGIARFWLDELGFQIPQDFSHPLEWAAIRAGVTPQEVSVVFNQSNQPTFKFVYRDFVFRQPGRIIGYTVHHGKLEKHLWQLCESQGVKYERRFIRSLDELRSFSARYYVGADGPYSIVRSGLGIPPNSEYDMHKGYEVWIPYKTWVNITEDDIHNGLRVIFDELAPRGYIWEFGYKDVVKIGLGVPLAYSSSVNLKDNLRAFLRWSCGFEDYELARSIVGEVGGVIPTPPPLKSVAYGNVALVGDAGNIINSATGGGIHTAMLSGAMCAVSIATNGLEGYKRWYSQKMYPLLRRWYRVKRVLYSLSMSDIRRLVKALDGYDITGDNPVRELQKAVWHVARRDFRILIKVLLSALK